MAQRKPRQKPAESQASSKVRRAPPERKGDVEIDLLLDFLNRSPSAFQAAEQLSSMLEKQRFRLWKPGDPLTAGDRRYIFLRQSGLIAWQVGRNALSTGMRIVGSHLDAPALKIKPGSILRSEGCLRLNVEGYGGPILHTWFDRPLSIAGQVALYSTNPLKPELRLVDFRRPLLTIPSLAIHMNPSVNEGQKIETQKMMLPVLALDIAAQAAPDDLLPGLLAEALGIAAERIAGYELYLYDPTPAVRLGRNREFFQAPHIDNLGMAYASVRALTEADVQTGLAVAACFDHEEVGSRTPQGANSLAMRDLLGQVLSALGGSPNDLPAALAESFLISADQAHGAHPNFPEAADPNHRPRLGGGPVLKTSAGRSYMSDGDSGAVFAALCRDAGVPCQQYVNHSDKRGGTTIGPMFTEFLPIRAVDVGNPIWGMHSIRETGGCADQAMMTAVFEVFYSR